MKIGVQIQVSETQSIFLCITNIAKGLLSCLEQRFYIAALGNYCPNPVVCIQGEAVMLVRSISGKLHHVPRATRFNANDIYSVSSLSARAEFGKLKFV